MKAVAAFLVSLALGLPAHAAEAPDAPELKRLLEAFLEGASRNDAAMHDRFWAEDLIYTRSSGVRIGKPEIMANLRSATPPSTPDNPTTYTAEDVRIQQYGDTAVVAFRLVGVTGKGAQAETQRFLNSGTFVRRNGEWRVVNWQSTRMAEPESQPK